MSFGSFLNFVYISPLFGLSFIGVLGSFMLSLFGVLLREKDRRMLLTLGFKREKGILGIFKGRKASREAIFGRNKGLYKNIPGSIDLWETSGVRDEEKLMVDHEREGEVGTISSDSFWQVNYVLSEGHIEYSGDSGPECSEEEDLRTVYICILLRTYIQLISVICWGSLTFLTVIEMCV